VAKVAFDVELEGMQETIGAVRSLERDLRRETNRELRSAAGECARSLVERLHVAAAASGVPVAQRVARSLKVKSDRLPVVSIGGTRRVGRSGAIAAKLLWGSEHGPADGADRNRFGVGRDTSGYWIAPTVERFASSSAIDVYRRAVYRILHKSGLL